MGLIRYLLAISVALGHMPIAQHFQLLHGEIAVKSFFLISGYYMAMIIKYYPNPINFWKSRYLRLFPTYIVFLLLAFVSLPSGGGVYIDKFKELPDWAMFLILAANVTMFLTILCYFLVV